MRKRLRQQEKNITRRRDSRTHRLYNSIALIYNNKERDRAERVAALLVTEGCHVVLAPLDLQVGTNAWKQRVRQDLLDADAVMLLLTEKSVVDKWVAWRVEQVFRKRAPIMRVVQLDDPLPLEDS
jgi:hypothetical protein